MKHILYTRRHVLRSITILPVGFMLAAGARAAQTSSRPACVLSPEMTEGPFFVDERLHRSDLVAGDTSPGLRDAYPLALAITFIDVGARCAPVRGMQVDVWHTDALGNYSDVQGERGRTFCRGYQITDDQGRVAFDTVYPGWYPGRAIHIHVKARRFDPTGRPTREFTTQLFFDEATNDAVMAMPPYNRRNGRRTSNARDGIYGNASSLIVRTTRRDDRPGLAGAITLGLDLA
ncbi:MAG TPA: twin-arginine translocation pathway signal protein [Casimicrobiaceae bacterium]|nr:twin-arginine translocation pathway signal protein [Casimicrobiaceae bacterium]